MSASSIPARASLPPAFTPDERAEVEAYFRRRRHARRAAGRRMHLAPPLFVAAIGIVTVITAIVA
jgi:hypothetical protein